MVTENKVKVNLRYCFGEDDEMSHSNVHDDLILYLMPVLGELFQSQQVGIFNNN